MAFPQLLLLTPTVKRVKKPVHACDCETISLSAKACFEVGRQRHVLSKYYSWGLIWLRVAVSSDRLWTVATLPAIFFCEHETCYLDWLPTLIRLVAKLTEPCGRQHVPGSSLFPSPSWKSLSLITLCVAGGLGHSGSGDQMGVGNSVLLWGGWKLWGKVVTVLVTVWWSGRHCVLWQSSMEWAFTMKASDPDDDWHVPARKSDHMWDRQPSLPLLSLWPGSLMMTISWHCGEHLFEQGKWNDLLWPHTLSIVIGWPPSQGCRRACDPPFRQTYLIMTWNPIDIY